MGIGINLQSSSKVCSEVRNMFQHYATHMLAPMKCLIDIQPTSNYTSGRREREQAISLRIIAKL